MLNYPLKKSETVIFICLILLIASNVVSIVWAVTHSGEVKAQDVISIVVTIILGVATVWHANQELKSQKAGVEHDIQQSTPYLEICNIARGDINSNAYKVGSNPIINVTQDPAFIKEPIFSYVHFDKERGIVFDIRLKNVSSTLLSKIRLYTIKNNKDNANPSNKYLFDINRFLDPHNTLIDAIIKTDGKDIDSKLYEEGILLQEQKYQNLFDNTYTSVSTDAPLIVNLLLPWEVLNIERKKTHDFPEEVHEEVPRVIFFDFLILMTSITGNHYVQTVKIGAQLHSAMTLLIKSPSSFYNQRYLYILQKIEMDIEPYHKSILAGKLKENGDVKEEFSFYTL